MATNQTDRPAPRTAGWDIAYVLGTLYAIKYSFLQVPMLWAYAGPVSLLTATAVATWRLHRNRESWADLGLRMPASVWKMLGWSLAALIATVIAGIVIGSGLPLLLGDASAPIDPRYAGRFANVPGNLAPYLFWVATAWIVGAFAEEMLFRAMLISRFERVFATLPFAVPIAVILQSVIFGQQHHYYQGLTGALATGAIALVSGAIYIVLKRGLWPLILSHGTANMIGLTMIYVGAQPPG